METKSKFCDVCEDFHSEHDKNMTNKDLTIFISLSVTKQKYKEDYSLLFTQYHQSFLSFTHAFPNFDGENLTTGFLCFKSKLEGLLDSMMEEQMKCGKCCHYVGTASLYFKSIVRQFQAICRELRAFIEVVQRSIFHFFQVNNLLAEVKLFQPFLDYHQVVTESDLKVECSICYDDNIVEHCVFQCNHFMCISCVDSHFGSNTSGKKTHHECHICREKITKVTLHHQISKDEFNEMENVKSLQKFCQFV